MAYIFSQMLDVFSFCIYPPKSGIHNFDTYPCWLRSRNAANLCDLFQLKNHDKTNESNDVCACFQQPLYCIEGVFRFEDETRESLAKDACVAPWLLRVMMLFDLTAGSSPAICYPNTVHTGLQVVSTAHCQRQSVLLVLYITIKSLTPFPNNNDETQSQITLV